MRWSNFSHEFRETNPVFLRAQLDAALRLVGDLERQRDRARAQRDRFRAELATLKGLSVDDIAGRLRVSPKTVYKLIVERKIPCVKVDGQWRITESEYQSWSNGPDVGAPERRRPPALPSLP